MLHKALVRVSFPTPSWASEMQLKRQAVPYDEDDPDTVLECEKGDIRIYTLSNDELDPTSAFEYEFVAYDKQQGVVVICLFIGDDDSPAHLAFDRLFTFKHGEAYEHERAFLIVPATLGRFSKVKAWAFAPTGKDAHGTPGAGAKPQYLQRLITDAGL